MEEEVYTKDELVHMLNDVEKLYEVIDNIVGKSKFYDSIYTYCNISEVDMMYEFLDRFADYLFYVKSGLESDDDD